MFPSPKTAEPSVITATVCPFIVKSFSFEGSFWISRHGWATPGEYAIDKSLADLSLTLGVISSFPLCFL